MNMTRVVIIDDDKEFRKDISRRIGKSRHFECVADYDDCETAIPNLQRDKPDIVLMDFDMPGRMSGTQGTAIIKHKMPQVEVVMLTVYTDDDVLFSSLRVGASGFLHKGSDAETITKRLGEFMDEGMTMSMGLARKVIDYFHTQQPAEPLTSREQEVLSYLLQGESNDAIAEKLHIDVVTIKFHNKNIYRKMHVSNKIELLQKNPSLLAHGKFPCA